MAQGFIKFLNLNESNSPSKDRAAINNLGGVGIADDLVLFSNNTLNKTIIEAGTFQVEGNYVVLDENIYQICFSNKTKVVHNGLNLTVVESDGISRFRLEDINNNIVVPNALSNIERRDNVTLDNIKNIVTSSLPTDQTASSALGDENGGITVSESSINISLSGGNQNTSQRFTLQESFSSIENLIDKYRYDRTFSIITDLPQTFERRIQAESTVTLTNDDSISLPTAAGQQDNAPGIFIASGANAQRAFSNNNNPWSDTQTGDGYMVTNSSKATISTLILTDPDFQSLSTTSVTSSDVIADATYKIKTIINGEPYYILCSNN